MGCVSVPYSLAHPTRSDAPFLWRLRLRQHSLTAVNSRAAPMLLTIGKSVGSALLGLVCLGLIIEGWEFAKWKWHG